MLASIWGIGKTVSRRTSGDQAPGEYLSILRQLPVVEFAIVKRNFMWNVILLCKSWLRINQSLDLILKHRLIYFLLEKPKGLLRFCVSLLRKTEG